MEENIKNAYFEVESLAYDLKYKSINQDEIKQGNNIYTLLHLIDCLLKENEELKLITQNYNAFRVDSPNSTKIIIADSQYFVDEFFKENFIPISKIKDLVDECIPVGKNIITREEEYQPNANANSYLTQLILELLKEMENKENEKFN